MQYKSNRDGPDYFSIVVFCYVVNIFDPLIWFTIGTELSGYNLLQLEWHIHSRRGRVCMGFQSLNIWGTVWGMKGLKTHYIPDLFCYVYHSHISKVKLNIWKNILVYFFNPQYCTDIQSNNMWKNFSDQKLFQLCILNFCDVALAGEDSH